MIPIYLKLRLALTALWLAGYCSMILWWITPFEMPRSPWHSNCSHSVQEKDFHRGELGGIMAIPFFLQSTYGELMGGIASYWCKDDLRVHNTSIRCYEPNLEMVWSAARVYVGSRGPYGSPPSHFPPASWKLRHDINTPHCLLLRLLSPPDFLTNKFSLGNRCCI